MVTDDNEADGALSGEAGETSFQRREFYTSHHMLPMV